MVELGNGRVASFIGSPVKVYTSTLDKLDNFQGPAASYSLASDQTIGLGIILDRETDQWFLYMRTGAGSHTSTDQRVKLWKAPVKYVNSTGKAMHRQAVDKTTLSIRICPNPCSPRTSFSFYLPKSGNVMLGIYSLNGVLVTPLVNDRTLGSGSHTVPWNAEGLTAGQYIVRFRGGCDLFSKKLMVVK